MLSNARLARVGGLELRAHHLLVLAVLALSFSVAMLMRSQSADYGFELNEFDPFFNYRATEYLVENGLAAYYSWHDYEVWAPHGRDISEGSQNMQHFTAAAAYHLFGGGGSLYEFLIVFSVVIGSLGVVLFFALVRAVAGTTAGLFASLMFAVSVPLITRGLLGWFKSEPVGLFYGLLGAYLFVSGLRAGGRGGLARLAGGGAALALGVAAWGGVLFFVLPIAAFLLALPLLRRDLRFLLAGIPAFAAALLGTSMLFEGHGTQFALGIGGAAVALPTAYAAGSCALQLASREELRMRRALQALAAVAGLAAAAGAAAAAIPGLVPVNRYLTVLSPLLKLESPLRQSVAEEAVPTAAQSMHFFLILLALAGVGAWLLLGGRDRLREWGLPVRADMAAFALLLGIFGAYISASFIRLELFGSVAVIALASVALSALAAAALRPSPGGARRGERPRQLLAGRAAGRAAALGLAAALLVSPLAVPTASGLNWVNMVKQPPTLLNGGTAFGAVSDDWPAALEWLRTSTPEGSVVAAWWDYGYWITVLGERTSLADNGTVMHRQIEAIATMFVVDPDTAWTILQKYGADYVLVFVAGEKIQESPPLYTLRGGGDESKKQWFMRISGHAPVRQYLFNDGVSGTDRFWDGTMIGALTPFSPYAYVRPGSDEASATYRDGYIGVYDRNVKFPSGGDGPVSLAYASPSFHREGTGQFTAVLIYEVNDDYEPGPPQPYKTPWWHAKTGTENRATAAADGGPPDNLPPYSVPRSAQFVTSQGQFTVELDHGAAPRTVENFAALASAGTYDNTIFHRIIPDYIVQGGDPNTARFDRSTWGRGDPGYSIEREESGLEHGRYAVSMASGDDPGRVGSQFFITLREAPALDADYTVFGRVSGGEGVVEALGALDTAAGDQPHNALEAVLYRVLVEYEREPPALYPPKPVLRGVQPYSS